MLQTKFFVIVLLGVAVFRNPSLVFAWPGNPTVNVPICTAPKTQSHQVMVSDGAAGAIIAWEDERTGDYFYDIYAQRVDANGEVQWPENGVLLCPELGTQRDLSIVSDGEGGAIIAWQDFRSNSGWDIRAQRVNASGILQWAENGVPICTDSSDQDSPSLASDGEGGVIIAWRDGRSTPGIYSADDIYAQRVNAHGDVQWAENGVPICTAPNAQKVPSLVSDGAGGAIIAWQDYRFGGGSYIYAQRVNANGSVQWTENGVAIGTNVGPIQPPIVSDGEGGATLTWMDFRNNTWGIYAQRVNANGEVRWIENGVAIGKNTGEQPVLVSDGAGGGIITWSTYRNHHLDVYAQRVNGAGIIQWTESGVAVCTASNDQSRPALVSDGSGGVIITWQDYRSDTWDIYAQRVNTSGSVQWTENGWAICIASHWQTFPALVSDGEGGGIITWWDRRSGNKDIYAQKIFSDGSLSGTVSSCEVGNQFSVLPDCFALFQNRPNPFNPLTTIAYDLPEASDVMLNIYTVTGQQVITLVSGHQEAGRYSVVWDGRDAQGVAVGSGLYFARLEASGVVHTRKLLLIR